jgi:protein gp37
MLRDIDAPVRFLSIEPMISPVDRVSLDGIAWAIVGGESGPGRRPLDPDWVRDVRDRCNAAGVAFFFKQWHKANTGRELDGRTWDEMPHFNQSGARHSGGGEVPSRVDLSAPKQVFDA